MVGAPETMLKILTDEEEDLPYPSVLFMYTLDANLVFYQVYNGKWKQTSQLEKP